MRELPYLVAGLTLVALLLKLDFVFYVLYVLGAVWLLARWATPRSLRSLRIQRTFVDHAFLGETVPVTVEFENTTWLPMPWLRVAESLPLELAPSAQIRRVYTLRPRERVQFAYTLTCTRRGYYQVGPLQLTSGDLFGLADVQARDVGSHFLTVYPRIIPLVDLALPSRLPFGTLSSRQPMFEDPARLRGVRTYQPGDSQRRINWKASAHASTLLVKQFSPAIALQSVIFLNLALNEYERQRRYSASEWAIVVAASVATYLEGARQAVGLATNGHDPLRAAVAGADDAHGQPSPIPPRPGRPHLMKVLEVLARIEGVEAVEPFPLWAQRAAVPLSWGTTVIVITPNADEAACQGLHRLVRNGLNVVLLAVEPYGRFELVRQRARRLGFQAYLVASEADLEQLQATRGTPAPRRRAA